MMNDRPQRAIRTRNAVVGLVLVAGLAAVAWFWLRGERSPREPLSSGHAASSEPRPESSGEPSEDLPRGAARWLELTGAPARWPGNLSAPADCGEVRGDLERICAALDARLPALRAEGGACALIEQLAVELGQSPPDPVAELSDHEAVVQNTFHLYRVARRTRMALARRALGEQELAEPAALALYRWAVSCERCSETGAHPLRLETLYAYAGFLFNTLGGQAYMRRRSPRVEALTCFYGLRILADAIDGGHNPQGIDPRPEIPRCRDLVESQDFVFTERYLAELDAIAERWDNRGPR
jgi:hypothetical protein